MSDLIQDAEAAIAAIETAAEVLAIASGDEMYLEDQRALVKSLAIRRLMATENPETGKPHSASSAEKIVESDEAYAAHRTKQNHAVVETIRARGRYEAQRRRADLAVALCEVTVALGGQR